MVATSGDSLQDYDGMAVKAGWSEYGSKASTREVAGLSSPSSTGAYSCSRYQEW